MSRHRHHRRGARALLILATLLLGAGCASGRSVVVVKQSGLASPRPVDLTVEELRAGMVMLTTDLPVGRSQLPNQLTVCPASTGSEGLHLVRRVPSPAGLLDAEARADLALEIALSTAVREAAGTLGSMTPVQVRAMLSMAIIGTIVCVVSPDPVSKFVLIAMSANLIAFLGVDLFNNVVRGYLDMKDEALAARDLAQVQAAGERYGTRLGPSVARILVMVATYGIAKLAGSAPTNISRLPGGSRAAALAEAQGFSVGAIDGIESMTVGADGAVTMVFGAKVAMGTGKPTSGGGDDSRFDPNEEPSPQKLEANLNKAGFRKPEGAATHHLVAGKAKLAERARELLAKFKIGINDAENGAFLPCNSKTPCDAPGPLHSKLHTRAYYEAIERALQAARSREEAIRALEMIRQKLLEGSFP